MLEDTALSLVEQAWTCVGRHDVDALLALLAPDVRWEIPKMPAVPFAGLWLGRDGVRRFFEIVAATQETIAFAPNAFIARGDTVVVLGRFENLVKATGKTVCSEWAQVWTARAGLLVAMREHVDTLAVNAAYLD